MFVRNVCVHARVWLCVKVCLSASVCILMRLFVLNYGISEFNVFLFCCCVYVVCLCCCTCVPLYLCLPCVVRSLSYSVNIYVYTYMYISLFITVSTCCAYMKQILESSFLSSSYYTVLFPFLCVLSHTQFRSGANRHLVLFSFWV